MAVPEKVLGIMLIENGKARIDVQRGTKGVSHRIILGEATGPDARFEFEDMPALIMDDVGKPTAPTGTPSPGAESPEPSPGIQPPEPSPPPTPVKKKRGRPPKKKAVKSASLREQTSSDVRIPIEPTPDASDDISRRPTSS